MNRKVLTIGLLAVLAWPVNDAAAGQGLLGVFDRIKAKRQAQREASIDGVRVLAALTQGKAVIFFPTSPSSLTWMDDLGDDSFVVGSGGDNSTASSAGLDFIVVEPGTYFLQHVGSQDFHKTQHVQYTHRAEGPGPGVGQVMLTNTQFPEPYTVSEWQGEVGHQEQYVESELCNDYGCVPNSYAWRYVVDSPAGYYPVTRYRDEDGVSLRAYFEDAKSPARITVGIGEVVVTDEVWFKDKESLSWDENQCAHVDAANWQCAMTGFRFLRWRGDGFALKNLRETLLKNGWSEQALANIKYRPLELKATVDERLDGGDSAVFFRNP
jgi:hypothetical protein